MKKTKKPINESSLAGFRPDPRPGRFGSVDTGQVKRGQSRGDYSAGAGKMHTRPASFPYIEFDIEADDDVDEEDIANYILSFFSSNPGLSDKIQAKVGGMKFMNDPGAKSRNVSMGGGNNRNFSGRVAESLPTVMGKSRKSGSTSIAPFPSTVLYPKKNRGPAVGGTSHSPSVYKTGPGHSGAVRTGGLHGYSKAPKSDFDDSTRVFTLGDIPNNDRRILMRIRKAIRDIIDQDSDE